MATLPLSDILKIPGVDLFKFEHYEKDLPDGDSMSYGELQPFHHKDPEIIADVLPYLFIMDRYMTGSDYSGTTVEKSNYEVFKEDHKDLLGTGIFDVWGGYSTFSVAISVSWLMDPGNEEKSNEIIEQLSALSDYPLLDEDHLSNMESDLEYEYITKDWSFDLNREMKGQHGIEMTEWSEGDIWDLYRELSERANEYPVFETNGWPYINTEELVKAYRIGDLTTHNIRHELVEVE